MEDHERWRFEGVLDEVAYRIGAKIADLGRWRCRRDPRRYD